MQSVLPPEQELSLCEIFHSSLTWASQHICITCYAISVKKDAGGVWTVRKILYTRLFKTIWLEYRIPSKIIRTSSRYDLSLHKESQSQNMTFQNRYAAAFIKVLWYNQIIWVKQGNHAVRTRLTNNPIELMVHYFSLYAPNRKFVYMLLHYSSTVVCY